MSLPFFSNLIFCSSLQILSFSGSALSLSTDEMAEYASLGPFDYKKQRASTSHLINSILSVPVMIIVSVNKHWKQLLLFKWTANKIRFVVIIMKVSFNFKVPLTESATSMYLKITEVIILYLTFFKLVFTHEIWCSIHHLGLSIIKHIKLLFPYKRIDIL